MKALSIRISAGIIALGALLYFLACSPTPQSNNSSQNQNLSAASASNASKELKACDDYGTDPHGSHAKGIKDGIEAKIADHPALKKLLKGDNNPHGTFTIEVKQGTDVKYFVAYIRGKVSGDDNLKELTDILNDFQDKSQCLRVIHFLPDQSSALTDGPGFEWGSCEYPLHMCPNGECCDVVSANTNTNVNTNSNGNSNSNSNANSNSNLGGGRP